MAYRTRKQFAISLVVFLFLAIVGTGLYFILKPKADCFDGIKNQDEEEIDCGGPCISCEILTLKEVEVIWTKSLLVKEDVYDLVAKIRNPNPNFGTSEVKYTFELKERSGRLIGQKSGITFILPRSNKYIIETNFESKEPIGSINLKVEKIPKGDWQKLKDYQLPELFVKDKKIKVTSEPSYLAEATGVVQNNTPFDFDKVFINIVLFSESGQAIGVSRTEVRTLLASEGRFFSVKWFFPLEEEVKSIDMQTETNLFSDENYMRKHGAPKEEL